MKGKIISLIIVFFILMGGVFICGSINNKNEYEMTNLSKEEFIETLNNASEILIMKEYFAIANKYYIIVDDAIVGTVKGEEIYLAGDTFTMRSSNGDLVSYEEEEILHWNNQASVKNESGEETGRIENNIFSLLYESYYFDAEGNKLATAEQQFSMLREDEILDVEGNVLYTIKDTNYLASNLVIEVKDNSVISPEIAIYIATIDEAIDSSSD